MDDFSGQGSSSQPRSGSPSDDDVLLASSCPKKRAGRKKVKETRHPVYRGIRLRNGNRWVCEVRTPTNNARIWLGSYPTAEMAARAHDVAALALRGRTACLNFADSAWRLPVPASAENMDIQRAAAEAAEMFRPPELADDEPQPTQDSNVEVQYSNNNNNEQVPVQENVQTNIYNNNIVPEATLPSTYNYMDEEAMFNMPGYLDDMAEGLMVPPPRNPSGWDDNDNDNGDFSLWNF